MYHQFAYALTEAVFMTFPRLGVTLTVNVASCYQGVAGHIIFHHIAVGAVDALALLFRWPRCLRGSRSLYCRHSYRVIRTLVS